MIKIKQNLQTWEEFNKWKKALHHTNISYHLPINRYIHIHLHLCACMPACMEVWILAWLRAWAVAWMDGCMHGCVCSQGQNRIFLANVPLKNHEKLLILTLCAHATMHVSHTCMQLNHAFSACMAVRMEVYVNIPKNLHTIAIVWLEKMILASLGSTVPIFL